MTNEYFEVKLKETLEEINTTLGVKAVEYVREGNRMHNFDIGAKMTGKIREEVIAGFALKHQISIQDMRNDLKKGLKPKESMVIEKFNDAINYLILEKISILHKINEGSIFCSHCVELKGDSAVERHNERLNFP